MNRIRSHISQNVVGYIAVFLAMTGSAAALQGRNSVDSGDIKKNAVRSADIKTPNGVKSADVANNNLKGVDIDESTLGKVPSATSADTATTALNAQNATHAQTAADAQALSGNTVVGEGDLDGPGLVTNSSCTPVSEPVPGAQPGDHVVLTPPSGWPTYEINLTARVTADTVSYEICNQSGVNQNFGTSPPLRFLLFR